jgi:hypothetical protein
MRKANVQNKTYAIKLLGILHVECNIYDSNSVKGQMGTKFYCNKEAIPYSKLNPKEQMKVVRKDKNDKYNSFSIYYKYIYFFVSVLRSLEDKIL